MFMDHCLVQEKLFCHADSQCAKRKMYCLSGEVITVKGEIMHILYSWSLWLRIL